MKRNHFFWLGLATLNIITLPVVSYAVPTTPPGLASHSTSALVAQNLVAQNLVAQSQVTTIATGTFVANEKPTTGTARIVQEGGNRYLELDSAFSTSNQGPDLQVLLDTSTTPPASYTNLTSTINLGKLQNYSGSQRYAIPEGVDVSSSKSVVIWCRMANATFGHAALTPTP